jgi:hypothetical protein
MLLQGLASSVPLGSESRGTQYHILLSKLYPQELRSLFVAFYDSQGYGGGILTRLHMG